MTPAPRQRLRPALHRGRIAAIALGVAGVIAFDAFVLPPLLRRFLGSNRESSVLPPVASGPPAIVRLLAGSPSPDRQYLLKPAKDAPDQNAFHDSTLNRRVLGLSLERWRFYQLVAANFSPTEPLVLDLDETPLEVRLDGVAEPVRAWTADEVLADADPAVARSGAAVLAALGRGAGAGGLPPHAIATWLVALPADRVDAAFGRLASATIRAPGAAAGADVEDAVDLAPVTVRKSSLDEFLLSPMEALEVEPADVLVSSLAGRRERERENEGPGAARDEAAEAEAPPAGEYGPR